MVERWSTGRIVGVALLLVLTTGGCVFSGDRSGIGSFDRTGTTQYAVVATVDENGVLTISEQRKVNGRTRDPSTADVGPPRILRDPFGYEPTPGTTYEMLLSTAVAAHQDPDAGTGQYSLTYLHDPQTDLPSDSVPSGGIEGGLNPEEFLDCVREEADVETRFEAIIAAIEDSDDLLFYRCI